MFMNLPNDIQNEIMAYLKTPNLCFFAMASKSCLEAARQHLTNHQQKLLKPPAINLVVGDYTLFIHSPDIIYN